jgi:hypothetical protein
VELKDKMCPMTFSKEKPEKCSPFDCAWFMGDQCALVSIGEILRKKEKFP